MNHFPCGGDPGRDPAAQEDALGELPQVDGGGSWRALRVSSLLFSPRGQAICVRGASVRGAFGLTPTPLNQRRILDGRSKTVGKCKEGLPASRLLRPSGAEKPRLTNSVTDF